MNRTEIKERALNRLKSDIQVEMIAESIKHNFDQLVIIPITLENGERAVFASKPRNNVIH